MIHRGWGCGLALVLVAQLAFAQASLSQQMAACAQLKDNTARLACYDRLAQEGGGAAAAPPAPSAKEQFGLAPAPKATEIPSIRSRLVGKFRGWQPGTLFKLENGQLWKCVNDDRAFYADIPPNPDVTITRSYFGAYWMEIPGVGRKVKVQRLK